MARLLIASDRLAGYSLGESMTCDRCGEAVEEGLCGSDSLIGLVITAGEHRRTCPAWAVSGELRAEIAAALTPEGV